MTLAEAPANTTLYALRIAGDYENPLYYRPTYSSNAPDALTPEPGKAMVWVSEQLALCAAGLLHQRTGFAFEVLEVTH